MTDPSWDAYRKLMPGAAVVTIDRHGSVSLFDGPVFFSFPAGRWCPVDDSVRKVAVGLMPVTGDFSPESAYKINPDVSSELQASIRKSITGAPQETPVPGQWTGTVDNSAEMKHMQAQVAQTEMPTTIGLAVPEYQTPTPTVVEQTVQRPSVVDRPGVIPVQNQAENLVPAPLVVQSNAQKSHVAAALRKQAAQLMQLADQLEK